MGKNIRLILETGKRKMNKNALQHAIKNIRQKVLDLNDITFNKRLGKWIGKSFEVPYVSYCQPLCGILKITFLMTPFI